MLTVTVAQRRVRLGTRCRLSRPAESVTELAGDLVGLHSSDPATPYLAARARVTGFQVGALEEALYGNRSLVRMLGMRRTMFVVPGDLAAVMNAACTRSFLPAERRRLAAMIEDQGIAGDGDRWLERIAAATLQALESHGEATARELTEAVPELGEKLAYGAGTDWAGTVGLSTRVLFLLAVAGKIVRARPRGTWLSSQYRWSRTEDWLGSELAEYHPSAARAELVDRWLQTFGPGTLTDIKWWTGLTAAQCRTALEDAGAEPVDLEGDTGFVAAGDTEMDTPGPSWVALLPGLDPMVMGWKERGWYLGDHAGTLFDRNGNAGPTIWLDGRIVGGWAQRETGAIVTRLLDDVGSEAADRIAQEGAALEGWLDGTRVRPRFRTPLERKLSGR